MMPSQYVFDRVVNVACAKDIQTWSYSAPRILKHIAARQYSLITPDREMAEFQRVTPAPFVVEPESRYLRGHDIDSIRSLLPQRVEHRAGWYLQQFVKLEACKLDEPDASCLIWDADTVPLKDLDFHDAEGKLLYYSATEHHAPYFDTITKLLGQDRVATHSFIAQCLPTKSAWVHELTDAISGSGQDWIGAVLSSVAGLDESEFSEYETLGNFIFARHPQDVRLTDRPWLRTGNSTAGSIATLSRWKTRKLARKYDFIAFENWDPVRPTRWQRVMAALGKARGGKR